jgi:hypothetical protein
MRKLAALVSVLALAGAGWAQERVPQEQATKFAKRFADEAAKVSSPQLKTDVDPDKAYAIHAGERHAMFIPDKNLSADTFAKAGREPTPVGQLWLRKVAPAAHGKAVDEDKLRIVTISVNNEDHPLVLSFVGVRKTGENQLELVFYGKDREPYQTAPLRKLETKQNAEEPVVLNAEKGAEDAITLLITLLGEYQGGIQVHHSDK